MGGFGSGRHGGGPTVEWCYGLDVLSLHREGAMTACPRGLWVRRTNEPGRWLEGVRLEWTPCTYGGQRPWFVCPRPECGRRCAVLYGERVFECRQCCGLTYESQRETRLARTLRKVNKARSRLGADGLKPPRMHWRTFHRLTELIDSAEEDSYETFFALNMA
jgi:Zn-finger protein